MPGYPLNSNSNQSSEYSTSTPQLSSNGSQEYPNTSDSEAPGGHQGSELLAHTSGTRPLETAIPTNALPGLPFNPRVEICQCYIIRFGSFTFCLHPPVGSSLESLSVPLSGSQQHAPILTFGPNPGMWPAAQNLPSVSNSSVLLPDRNPPSAPQPGLLPRPSFVHNPGVQLPVTSFVSGHGMNRPVSNPTFVQYPVRQLHVPNSSFIPNPGVTADSCPTVFVNSSLLPLRYPSFLHNPSMPPTPNSYLVPNSSMHPPAPNPSHPHYQIRNPTPPVQQATTIQSDIISHPSNQIPPSFSYPSPVINWQRMPYSVPQHHPGNLNLNLNWGPRNETVILNPSPPSQAGNFPARNNNHPAPQPNYYNQRPGYIYLYSNPTYSTIITTVQNSYPSEINRNPTEQNLNPHPP